MTQKEALSILKLGHTTFLTGAAGAEGRQPGDPAHSGVAGWLRFDDQRCCRK